MKIRRVDERINKKVNETIHNLLSINAPTKFNSICSGCCGSGDLFYADEA